MFDISWPYYVYNHIPWNGVLEQLTFKKASSVPLDPGEVVGDGDDG